MTSAKISTSSTLRSMLVPQDLGTPTRVESMVNRVDVHAMALGHSHSLFLDANGAVWSCGENKEVSKCADPLPLWRGLSGFHSVTAMSMRLILALA